MTPRQESLRLIEAAGADFVDYGGGPYALHVNAWTPPGKAWMATGGHSLSVHYATNRPAGWVALLADLRCGVQGCDLPDCESCEEDGADS